MFIEPEDDRVRPPPGGPCLVESKGADMNTEGRVPILRSINIALLTEGGPDRRRVL